MRLVARHLCNVAKSLREAANQCGIAQHGGNIGAAREALTGHFLRDHLAANVGYFTGEIFDQNDTRSGQIDIILQPIGAPRLNLFGKINMAFADWVLAAIEVKSHLSTANGDDACHLKAALDGCQKVKALSRARQSPVRSDGEAVIPSRIPYVVFAFDGPTVETLRDKIHAYQTRHSLSLEMLPDLITVLSRDYYLMRNNGWLIPVVPGPIAYTHNSQPEGVLVGMYAYLTKLIEGFHMRVQTTPFSAYLRNLVSEA